MENYLATTAIPEIWDKERHIILLGPWCATDENMKLLEGGTYEFAESPWRPFAAKLQEADNYCCGVYESLMPVVGRKLNALHNVERSEKYWRILVGPWLKSFIEILYDRYIRVGKVLERRSDIYTSYISDDQDIACYDTHDFVIESLTDAFNLKLFSLIARRLKIPAKEVRVESHKYEIEKKTDGRPGFKHRLKMAAIKSFNVFSGGEIVVIGLGHVLGHVKGTEYLKLLLRGLRPYFIDTLKRLPFEVSLNDRQSLVFDYEHEDPFVGLLRDILHRAMPTCYIEGYGYYLKNTVTLSGVKVLGSGNGFIFAEDFKFIAANAAENGTKLVEFQHGGGYGIMIVSCFGSALKDRDMFYTWGWSKIKSGPCPLSRLPSPHLSKIKDTHLCSNEKALYIGNSSGRYFYRLESGIIFPENFVTYIDNIKRFLQNIHEDVAPCLIYRPYPVEYGWKLDKVVLSVCPNIEILRDTGRGKNLTDWMRTVKICVIDNPYTTYIEALAINVPTILFWDHDVWLMSPDVERYFERLRRAGVLYRTPEEAAKKLREVFDNPAAWWNGNEVQSARREFLDVFGYTGKDWIGAWVGELKRFLKE